uniref:DNA-directed RNA polymerases I and III subunit RPAC1 isoform X1 n=1 Tax=Tanacetum cinerariifolium TaxID=118510 RepID=A0A6L2N3X7_TANCI|nr:DNA-directed RNA polymerases I and III subunit RPAC1 isoform X1 [Tanacetum cinerariifolium]
MPKVPLWDLPELPKNQLPDHLQQQKTRVFCNNDAPTHTDNIVFSGAYAAMGVGNSVRLNEFRKNFKVDIIKMTEEDMEFDLIGIDASIANGEENWSYFECQSQESLPEFSENPITVMPNIILSKLGPGQEIELEAHAVKGMGKTHAKWSPVATAWYRMLPEVILLKGIEDEDPQKLVKKCPVNVFDIEDIGDTRRATVARPRACTLCRECIKEPVWEEKVALRRVKDHFIFTIESTGALPPEVLFTEAVHKEHLYKSWIVNKTRFNLVAWLVKETKLLDHMASEDWSAASEKADVVESGKSSMCRRSTRTDLSDESSYNTLKILLAMEYLHMLGIVYCDLKPDSVLIREDGRIMLTDFDLSLGCSVNPTLVNASNLANQPLSNSPQHRVSLQDSLDPRKTRNQSLKLVIKIPELMAEPTGGLLLVPMSI